MPFQRRGERPLNLGGSTGLEYFRPLGAKYEAARLIARENVIEGISCAAAFVGVDGAEFSGNTVLFPQRWIFRLLQETTAEGFIPSRNVLVQGNRVVFRRADIREFVNIGGGTAPETFRFERTRGLPRTGLRTHARACRCRKRTACMAPIRVDRGVTRGRHRVRRPRHRRWPAIARE